MVDTLGEDWWIESTESSADTVPTAVAETETSVQKNPKRQSEVTTDDVLSPPSKRKKRQKRMKITDKLAKQEDTPATLTDFNKWLDKCGKGTLSTVELEDLHLEESSMLEANTAKYGLSDYLTGVVPKWKSLVKAQYPDARACTLLIVTSSGRRAVDLSRDAGPFRGKCNTAKLFAKHIKLKEQVALLSKKKVDFAVGTPNRIASVIDENALDVTRTKYVILDWNWRDVKQRRLIDMPELEKDLFSLLKSHFIPAMKGNAKMRIGLF